MKTVAVTGHRPKTLGWGYNLGTKLYYNMYRSMYQFLREEMPDRCITGMALGVDTVFALAALSYRDISNKDVDCYIPFNGQELLWSKEDQERYVRILKRADHRKIITDNGYSAWAMQKRNEWMVDETDILLAVWNGIKKGGTWNCIRYAQKKNVPVIIRSPNDFRNT